MKKITSFRTSLLLLLLLLSTGHRVLAKHPTSFTKFQITSDGHQQNGPLIYGDKVVWTDWRSEEGLDIWMYDLKTKSESPLIVKPGHQVAYGIWGNKIIYRDESTSPPTMRVYNINTNKDIEIAQGENVVGGAIYSNLSVYVDGIDGGNMYVYNLASKKSKFITNNVYNPKIWGNNIVWTVPLGGGEYTIKGYNLAKDKLFDIAQNNNITKVAPDIFQDTVVWLEKKGALNYEVCEKNLITGKEKIDYETVTSSLGPPAISNQYIVWVDDRGIGAHDIFTLYRHTGEIVELSNDGPQQPSPTIPDIYKDTAVWMSWVSGNGDIYAATLNR